MISYAICTHNEQNSYISPLLDKLIKFKQPEDEIVLLDDFSDNIDTVDCLNKYRDQITIKYHALDNDFAAHKNFLNSLCKGEYIVQLDADESMHEVLIRMLPELFTMNPSVDLFTIARINIVPNITQEDILRWGWRMNDKMWLNFPDRQTRIYKNKPNIVWEGRVHERIVGFDTHSELPDSAVEYCLFHMKSLERQKVQNELYSKMSNH